MNWDIADEPFDNLTGWIDGDAVNGVSEISPAGQLRLDANIAAAGNCAQRLKTFSSLPNIFTLRIKVYHDLIDTFLDNGRFVFLAEQADEHFRVYFNTDGLRVYDTGSGATNIGSDFVKSGGDAEWQTWQFNVTFGVLGEGICDIYLADSTHNYTKVGAAIPCSHEGAGTDGRFCLSQNGITTDNMLSHVDYVKAKNGHYAVYPAELVFSEGSMALPQSGIRLDRASNGDIRTRHMYSAGRQDFKLTHYLVNAADKVILDAFYAANKGLEIILPWIDGIGYNCMFADAPKYTPIGAGLYSIEVMLAQKDE